MPAPLLLTMVFALGAPGLKDKSPGNPIDGSWTVQSCLVGGQADAGLARAPIDRIEIGDGRWRVIRGSDRPAGSEIVLDPKKRPAEIDFVDSAPGIYKVDGETLTVCYDMAG